MAPSLGRALRNGRWSSSTAESGDHGQPLLDLNEAALLETRSTGNNDSYSNNKGFQAGWSPSSPSSSSSSGPLDAICCYLDTTFLVSRRGSTISQEIQAGLVTWVTMSYIVVVNPMILSAADDDGSSPIPFHAACRATCYSAALACAFVGLVANLPFGLAAGMGLNSYLRYGIIGKLGMSPESALTCVFTQGVIFALLASSGIADKAQALLPGSLKSSITVAIGIFQAFVGFQLMGLVTKNDTTMVGLGDLAQPTLWLAMTSTILVAALFVRGVKGATIMGIAFTALASHMLGLQNARESSGPLSSDPLPSSEQGFFPLDFSCMSQDPQAFATAVLCMLFIVVFDTAGVQHGVGQQAGLLDSTGSLPGAKFAYLASALGTSVGAVMGTSPVIIHNESAAGVQEGGRTGLCALTTGLFFLVSPVLVPVIEFIPPQATAPCLVLVGALMMTPIRDIDFTNLRLALPAFLTICVTPLAYSISAGIFSGIATYVILDVVLRFAEVAEKAAQALMTASRQDEKICYEATLLREV
mmetsp:Transcript_60072/g.127253  ORF Transcript_60072/g.127253 Transcript_60072/m.127253 type:complete len:529 (+) Transcript_60072:62-1648(+)